MASFVHLIDQRRLIGPGGSTVAGEISFYYTGTTVRAAVYYDAAMTVPAPNPIAVAAGEIVPLIYLDEAIVYRRIIVYSDGTEDDQDPLGVIFSEGEIGVPVGSILDYSGTTAPDGFLLCAGQAISRTEFPDLFAAIGVTYGAGDGSSTFNVPDIRGRIAAGKDNMGGSTAGRLSSLITGTVLGATGGIEEYILTSDEMPSHTHGVTDPGHTHGYINQSVDGSGFFDSNPAEDAGPVAAVTDGAFTGLTINAFGGGEGHNNVQPTIIVNKIIKSTPVTFLSLIGVNLDFTGKAQAAALGVAPSADDMGVYSGTLLNDNESAKQNIQQLETAAEDRPTFDNLYDTSGGSLVRWSQSGAGAIPRTVTDKLKERVSVLDYGAVGDGVTNDTAAIQAALAYVCSVGGELFFPRGTYLITSTLTVDTGLFNIGVILSGEGRNSVIYQTATGVDAIRWSNTQILQNSGIRDLHIVCDADAGHCINIFSGCTTNFFYNVEMEQNNPAKSCIYGDYTAGTGGVYDTHFRGGSWYTAATSTVPGVDIRVGGTLFNENIFENLRAYNSNTAQFFKIAGTAGASFWMINNVFRNINFEVCKGGGVYFTNFKNCRFEGLSFWDSLGSYTNHLIDSAAGTGIESIQNTFVNCGRNGDSVAVGVNDIRTISGQDFVYINCYTQSGDSPRYDFNNKRATVIGKLFGTLNNTSGITFFNSVDGLRFGGTVNGASLAYYDEGTWTAILGGSTADPTTPVTASGRWTRVGRQVNVDVAFANVTTTGATGTVQIRGLPFAAGSGSPQMGLVTNLSLTASPAVGFVNPASTTVALAQQVAIGTPITYGAGVGQYLYFNMTYTV